MARSKNDRLVTAEASRDPDTAVETYTPDQRRSLSDAVLAAIDASTDVDLGTSEFVLHDAVDPDALDALFRHDTDSNTTVSFDIEGLRVEIRGNETVHVDVSERRER